ncbi:MAG: HU family DNA-binding protein [Ignavibacteria bacterium]|nr:HU family DNA-binding protein [Ignavibacteria bacterium]
MSHDELVNMISERAGISRQTVRDVLQTITDVWSKELLAHGELSLENIGEFLTEHRPGRKALNSETKEIFLVPPKDGVTFLPSEELIEWSNKS